MSTEKRYAAVLGSTGSVGTQSLEVAEHLGVEVKLLTAASSWQAVEAQARKFHPDAVAMADTQATSQLKLALADTDISVTDDITQAVTRFGETYKSEAVAVNAVTGIAGLYPALAAAKTGVRITMANKEAIVTAGRFLFDAIRENNAEMIPVDSEHSAIFRCINGIGDRRDISKLLLTASGGPFYGKDREYLKTVTAADALAHPTWKMGAKITVDSATLMNKGFEIIEAVRLFGVPEDKVQVVVQRESIIHSMVETADGAVLAQLGTPDMRTCIAYAMTYPHCKSSPAGPIDFDTLRSLSFGVPDNEAFPLLELARYAIRRDGIVPTVLNAADETAVAAFLNGRIGFCGIADAVSHMTVNTENVAEPSLEDIIEFDKQTRVKTAEYIASASNR